jgi:hypothetical protein
MIARTGDILTSHHTLAAKPATTLIWTMLTSLISQGFALCIKETVDRNRVRAILQAHSSTPQISKLIFDPLILPICQPKAPNFIGPLDRKIHLITHIWCVPVLGHIQPRKNYHIQTFNAVSNRIIFASDDSTPDLGVTPHVLSLTGPAFNLLNIFHVHI